MGYQPTGIKPLDLLLPTTVTSKTAKQLLSALAMYKVFSSVLSATPLVAEPAGALGYSAQLRVSSTFLFLISITETLLSSPLAT